MDMTTEVGHHNDTKCRALSRQIEPVLRKVEYEVWKRCASITNDCWLWAGFLDWDFHWVRIFSIFLIFSPSLSFHLPQCPFSFPFPMAKLFHLVYTMGIWSLLWIEAEFKNVQNLIKIVGRKAVPCAYYINLWEECLSALWLEANDPYHTPISRGTWWKKTFLFFFKMYLFS